MVSIRLGNISPGTWFLQPAHEPERDSTHKASCKGDPSFHVQFFPLIWLTLSPSQALEVFPIMSLTKAWERRDGVLEPIVWDGDLILPVGVWSGMSLAHPSYRLGGLGRSVCSLEEVEE